MIKKYLLIILLIAFSIKGMSQNNYAVSSIPFQQFTGTLSLSATLDDYYSPNITLPFSFDFYGNIYNSIVVSTNGYIDFGPNLGGTNSAWSFSQTIPNASFPVKNAILGCFHDLNNSDAQGTITYGIYGTAPYRKFVVVFDNNSQFQCNAAAKSSFQMILYETSNIIDVQIIKREVCATWNGGRAVIGLINDAGTMASVPPGRNTGTWAATHEGWRFSRAAYYANYSFVKCDGNTDGFETFDLQVVQNDLSPSNPTGIAFYQTLTDAQSSTNALSGSFTNTSNPQTIYANVNGQTKQVVLKVIDCVIDNDSDNVATTDEDINIDTNLANDDTDGDGLPNYLDNDDDGDLILTNLEYVFAKNSTAFLDSDTDGIPNYLDNDDDGDGTLTFMEDYDGNGNPGDDDVNANGVPDYLDNTVLSLQNNEITNRQIELYPNPAETVLNIENNSNQSIQGMSIYSINGVLVKQIKAENLLAPISVVDLQSGIYFVKLKMENQVLNYKFIKK